MEALIRRPVARASSHTRPEAVCRAPALVHPLAFEREHLRSYFEGGLSAPIVLLQAPAGFGKTTALSFLVRHEGASVRWATLRERDGQLAQFVATVMSAMYGWDVEPPSPPPDVREAAALLVGAIEELGVSSLILDDYETVAAFESVNALVEALTERLPAYVRLAVASESMPEFVRRARLRQSIVELDQSDLLFDADDVTTYLRDIHHYVLPAETASSIARRANGCVAVINLVGQLVHNLPRYLRVDFDMLPLGSTVPHLATLLREVLARAHFPPAQAARDLEGVSFGYADGTLASDALLDLLASRHCLAQAFATAPKTIVPHKLLKQLAPLL